MKVSVSSIVLEAIPAVVPLPIANSSVQQFEQSVPLSELNVFVGVVGEVKGSLILYSTLSTFQTISSQMYGMALEGEMLDSFAGEIANMLSGTIASLLFNNGTKIDITPPNVIKGSSTITGKRQMDLVSFEFVDIGQIHILLNLED